MGNDEKFIAICKIGGPLVLFVCAPTFAITFCYVIKKDIDAGLPLNVKFCVGWAIFFSGVIWFGVYICRNYLGWFGGDRKY